MVEVEVAMSPIIRRDVVAVTNQCSDHNINIIFEPDKMILLGYTETTFCMCTEIIESRIAYTIMLEDSVLLSMISCDYINFSIDRTAIIVSGLDKDKEMVRQAKVRYNADTLATYQATFFQDLTLRLKAGNECSDLGLFTEFEKMSKVNDKGSRGVVLANNQIYTEGDGFKFHAVYKSNFNCFLLSDDLSSLIKFMSRGASTLYELDGYIVSKTRDCYFGIRVAEPMDNMHDLELVLKQNPLAMFNVDLIELKSVIRPIRVSHIKDGQIILTVDKGRIVLALGNTVYNIPYEFQDVTGASEDAIKLDFKLFNKLLQAMVIEGKSTIKAYKNFITISGAHNSCLLVSRG